jgi:hypothetical protein
MGTVQHRIIIGRSREVRGPDALERGFAGIIIAVAMVMAIWFGLRLIAMTQAIEAVSLASGPQINAVLYRAEHGRWPSPGDRNIVAADNHGAYVRRLMLGAGGVVTAQMSLGPARGMLAVHGAGVRGSISGLLSFRPELLGSQDAPSISFLCGYAKPLAGAFDGGADNPTSLPPKYLPPFCR